MPFPRLKILGSSTLAILVLAAGCRRMPTEPPSLDPVDPATVLFVDDFDTENGGVGAFNFRAFQNWNVIAGCVDLHGNGFPSVLRGVHVDQGLFVDLDGTCKPPQAGTIETKNSFALEPGNYILEFWLAGNSRIPSSDTVTVSLGSLHTENIVLASNAPFRLHTRNITVTQQTSPKIRFVHQGGDDHGVLLDLVRLRRAN